VSCREAILSKLQLSEDGSLQLSPSDLSDYLACAHLTSLELGNARGEIEEPVVDNAQGDLIRRKGDEHEGAYLDELKRQGENVLELPRDADFAANAAATEEALREARHDVIYQACFASDGWRGYADFLERQPDGTYEAVDTKLARHAKPAAVLQLCFYSQELGRIQGRLPERLHVVLGTRERESFRLADFEAYYRRVRARFLDFLAREPETYPWPVRHCRICDFLPRCTEQWERDDHLTRVAFIRRDQIGRLEPAGITTLEQLGDVPAGTNIDRIAPPTFEALRHQAALQLEHRRTGLHRYELLPPEPERGLGLLPRPSEGDLFLDFEGDPFFTAERGLEYLTGLMDTQGAFTAIWAHGFEEEKRALEQLIDLVHERLAADPGLHVYHYAPYELTALRRLVAQYATREDELDELLRREVFVDLYAVVRQALRHSHRSYSIKRVREFFMTAKTDLGGGDAIVDYERWLETGDDSLLEAIERYNEEDCLSTLRLRDWLVERKVEAEERFGTAFPWREPPERRAPTEEAAAERSAREEVRDRLLAAGDPELELLGHLLEYHRREARPAWRAFFSRLERTAEQLLDDSEAIGCVEPDGTAVEVGGRSTSIDYGFTFPAQQHKLAPGDGVTDPRTGRGAGTIVALDDTAGTLTLRRGPSLEDVPLPEAIVPGGPMGTKPQQAALVRLASDLGRYPHLERLLRREAPLGGARVQRETLDEMQALTREVEGSYLFVQGPPGSGKTWTGARLIAGLLAAGKRVGVSSTSHKAIHNLLREVEAVAPAGFRGLKKKTGGNPESVYDGAWIECVGEADFTDPEIQLVAGTAWLFCRPELDQTLDYLFVDEAGQVSLADALALGTAARTLVLLGDPVQLAQVTQAIHPAGAGRSVLAHLLGEHATVPEGMGLFLDRSWRMHPDVCRYVSTAFYEGRLESAAPERACAAGTGVRWLPVEHEGNRTASEEEAAAIAAELEARGLSPADVIVVAPYNAQVRLLAERLPGIRVGTVDKFQGQEASVVFFSMATSSGQDAPRGIDFLMSRNRLNVAVSRAQCLAYLVCSPRLLEIDARTIEHMRLANALCRFVEVAEG
jgi:predicted RecB family nuclease